MRHSGRAAAAKAGFDSGIGREENMPPRNPARRSPDIEPEQMVGARPGIIWPPPPKITKTRSSNLRLRAGSAIA